MKRPKELIATGKTVEKAMKQARHWFSMNPNRKVISLKMSDKTFLVHRGEKRLLSSIIQNEK
jgi:hypothetical protein